MLSPREYDFDLMWLMANRAARGKSAKKHLFVAKVRAKMWLHAFHA